MQLRVLAGQLGDPIGGRDGNSIEVLSPRTQANAFSRSLSATHGKGAFPLHTDGAHLAQPPRYIVLACVNAGQCPVPTILARFDRLDLHEPDISALEAAPFLVRNGRRSFYVTPFDADKMRIRYDRGCMIPVAESSSVARRLDHALEQAPHHSIEWRPGDVVVIDNWRVLHGRGFRTGPASEDRTLLRMSIQ